MSFGGIYAYLGCPNVFIYAYRRGVYNGYLVRFEGGRRQLELEHSRLISMIHYFNSYAVKNILNLVIFGYKN